MTRTSVAAGAAHRLVEYAAANGAGRSQLLARSGISDADLADHDARLPLDAYVRLIRAAKELCDDPALPLHFAEAVDMSEFSVVGLLGHASATMAEAFAQLSRYSQLVVEVDVGAGPRFELVRNGGRLWVVDHRREFEPVPELTEASFARMICGTRRLGATSLVREVHVTHAAPDHRAEYDRIFGVPPVFESHWNAMAIDEAWLAHPVSLQPRYVFGILTRHADALLAELERSKTVRGEVESLLLPILHTGTATADVLASRMGVTRLTLHRRLRREGVSFGEVLQELRRELAFGYLRGGKVSINETAYLLGFSDAAAFSRAFRRWTGRSPRDWRSAAGTQD